jgi:hypothetical protein
MSASPAPASRGVRPARFLAAIAFAAAGLLAAVLVTAALGYGRDVHTLRAAAVCVILVFGFFLSLSLVGTARPLGAPVRRTAQVLGLASAAATVMAAVVAWLFVPSRPGGMSLREAVLQRDALQDQMNMPPADHLDSAAELKQHVQALTAEYPRLAAPLRPELERWADAAAAAVGERFAAIPPDDLDAARTLRDRAVALGDAFPQHADEVNTAVRGWIVGAGMARSTELSQVPPGDWAAFESTGQKRRALVAAFSVTRSPLTVAEAEWAKRTAAAVIESVAKENPRQRRQAYRECDEQLRPLKGLDTTVGRFPAARRMLLEAAHAAAGEEVAAHVATGQYDLAHAVAAAHWLEWLPTARHLGPEYEEELNELQEATRELHAKSGNQPEPAPAPRPREQAPPPREKR